MTGFHQPEYSLKMGSKLTLTGILKAAAHLRKDSTTDACIPKPKANCLSIKKLHHYACSLNSASYCCQWNKQDTLNKYRNQDFLFCQGVIHSHVARLWVNLTLRGMGEGNYLTLSFWQMYSYQFSHNFSKKQKIMNNKRSKVMSYPGWIRK